MNRKTLLDKTCLNWNLGLQWIVLSQPYATLDSHAVMPFWVHQQLSWQSPWSIGCSKVCQFFFMSHTCFLHTARVLHGHATFSIDCGGFDASLPIFSQLTCSLPCHSFAALSDFGALCSESLRVSESCASWVWCRCAAQMCTNHQYTNTFMKKNGFAKQRPLLFCWWA